MGAADQAKANTSLGSALPTQAPGGTAQCPYGTIRIGIFFDGTNCNMFRDWGATQAARKSGKLTQPKKAGDDVNGPTNVAKLHEIFIEKAPTQKRVYIIGVGGGDEKSQAGDSGNLAAQGTGAGGRARIDKGIAELEAFFNTGQHQKACEKRVDAFGFSRGAAEARDFMNKVRAAGIDNTSEWDGAYKTKYVGKAPVRVKAYKRTEGVLLEFLGIFDTVASFGVGAFASWGNSAAGYDFTINGRPADKKKTPDQALKGESTKEKEQWVHRTFHAIAEDEYREVFPVEVAGLDPKKRDYKVLPKYIRERPYPGSHSDVGGGYRHSAKDGDTPEKFPDLCNIPLEDMHEEAKKGHVPLNPISSLPASVRSVSAAARSAYNSYLGERESIFRKHLGSNPKYADYLHDMKKDPVYLQALPKDVFKAIQKDRTAAPGYKGLLAHYIHDSNTGALWNTTNVIKKLVNWSRTFASQRGVNYRGPQNSYDPDSTKVK